MTLGTALVLGLLVVMCGGIAYVGDLLGRRMGKKRLTLFGLRPRHTAVVFTVVTGMVIAAVTLAALMLVSVGVRVAVTRGERLLHDNHRLKQERHALDAIRRQLMARNDDLEKTNAALAQTNGALRGEGDRLRAETGRLQQRTQALLVKNQGLGERNRRLEARNTGLVNENRSLVDRNRSLTEGNQQLLGANRHLEQANRGLVASNAGLLARNQGLQTEKKGLEQARKVALQQLKVAQGDLVRARSDLTRVQHEVQNATRVVNELRAQGEHNVALEAGKIIVHAGEELSRGVIPAGAAAEAVRATVETLLEDADAAVARREGRAAGRPRRIRLASHGEAPDQLLDEMVTALMTESHPVAGRPPAGPMPEIHPLVLRALARENAAAGATDPIEVDVLGKVNMLAFHRGEEVASLVVSTASTSGQLLQSLVAFLHGQVREAAMEHSVLPDAAGGMGEIDYESLLEVVGKIKRTAGQARIGAVAAADAWTAGPLRLDFYVVPADTRVAKDKDR